MQTLDSGALTESIIKTACEDSRVMDLFRYIVNSSAIRVINYHNTSVCNIPRFEREIKMFGEHFGSTSIGDIDNFFETGKWRLNKPGLIPAVYEGWRNNYDVFFPLLGQAGYRGWFFIPSFFPDVDLSEQIAFTPRNGLRLSKLTKYKDGRVAMNWHEVRKIAENHEICCHTGTHFRMNEDTSDTTLKYEIVDAKARLEDEIGRKVDVFCWNKGEEARRVPRAIPFLQEAGFRYVVSNLKFEKIG